ncbi:MAG TPA: helix-turn-helix transcriptional regulator [Pseudonocardia sp.]
MSDGQSAQPASPEHFKPGGPGGDRVGSTVLRMAVGVQLRRRREAAGVSRDDAAYLVRASGAKISRMELGRHRFKERDLLDLLTLYGVLDPDERMEFLELARQANTPGWWQRYGDLMPSWFETYVAMEQAASLIRTFEVQFVPGLLQTAEYARAVFGLGKLGPEQVERRVELRRRRQEILTSADPPQLWAVIDEAALRRPLAGAQLCKRQLAHLIELDGLPNVSLQIATFGRGVHPATSGPFTILRFPVPELADVVYLEQLNSALYLDRASDVEDYVDVWNRLITHVEPPANTRACLETIRAEVCSGH